MSDLTSVLWLRQNRWGQELQHMRISSWFFMTYSLFCCFRLYKETPYLSWRWRICLRNLLYFIFFWRKQLLLTKRINVWGPRDVTSRRILSWHHWPEPEGPMPPCSSWCMKASGLSLIPLRHWLLLSEKGCPGIAGDYMRVGFVPADVLSSCFTLYLRRPQGCPDDLSASSLHMHSLWKSRRLQGS